MGRIGIKNDERRAVRFPEAAAASEHVLYGVPAAAPKTGFFHGPVFEFGNFHHIGKFTAVQRNGTQAAIQLLTGRVAILKDMAGKAKQRVPVFGAFLRLCKQDGGQLRQFVIFPRQRNVVQRGGDFEVHLRVLPFFRQTADVAEDRVGRMNDDFAVCPHFHDMPGFRNQVGADKLQENVEGNSGANPVQAPGQIAVIGAVEIFPAAHQFGNAVGKRNFGCGAQGELFRRQCVMGDTLRRFSGGFLQRFKKRQQITGNRAEIAGKTVFQQKGGNVARRAGETELGQHGAVVSAFDKEPQLLRGDIRPEAEKLQRLRRYRRGVFGYLAFEFGNGLTVQRALLRHLGIPGVFLQPDAQISLGQKRERRQPPVLPKGNDVREGFQIFRLGQSSHKRAEKMFGRTETQVRLFRQNRRNVFHVRNKNEIGGADFSRHDGIGVSAVPLIRKVIRNLNSWQIHKLKKLALIIEIIILELARA